MTAPVVINAPVPQFIGDTWQFVVSVFNTDGTPFDLTGHTVMGEFWKLGNAVPVADLALGSGITLPADLTTGKVGVTIASSITAGVPAQTSAGGAYPTRIQVIVIDAASNRQTASIVPIIPLDPRSVQA